MASPFPWLKFNLLETVGLDNKVGHLFVVDIQFDECEYMYNEIMPPITEKQTKWKVIIKGCQWKRCKWKFGLPTFTTAAKNVRWRAKNVLMH